MEMKNKIPESLKDCCEILDSILSPEMIDEIKESKSYIYMIKFHFFLGMYIRNNWLQSKKLLEDLGYENGLFFMGDNVSSEILEYYWFYLHGYIDGSRVNLDKLHKNFDRKNKHNKNIEIKKI